MGGGGGEEVMGFSNERHLGWVKEGVGGGGGAFVMSSPTGIPQMLGSE